MLSTSQLRPTCSRCTAALKQHTQQRNASLLRRPKKPYTFTQLITLSDGSTFTHRTTSPQAVYRSTKDVKNSMLWNPSSQKLLNIEEDEAGRLRRFRRRFGRGFDAETTSDGEETAAGQENQQSTEDSLMDLISGYGQDSASSKGSEAKKDAKAKSGKK
ncbi:Hypothetical protein R9X50_00016700 [Acrodontium crateriforme]|uniref:Ribosomal protein bL31m N-terminal domain-containing protein n=1 Tax=Acrodontium crateriforme TaxID=150365 RepID=A0AAQ3LXA7_9PEZI|nr:Hypothetical protein R9X50_00016700 [Acrodontium crateriforme]